MLVTIFYYVDEFCKIYEKEITQKALADSTNYHRNSRLTLSDILTISIFYHYSGYKTFKDYYEKHVLIYMQNDFEELVSYNRFLELKKATVAPLACFIQLCGLGACTGLSFIDSFSLKYVIIAEYTHIKHSNLLQLVAKRVLAGFMDLKCILLPICMAKLSIFMLHRAISLITMKMF